MDSLLLTLTDTPVPTDWTQTIVTIGTVLFGAGAIKVYKLIIATRKARRREDNADSNEYKDSLKAKVDELESKVDDLQIKIGEMIGMYTDRILVLSTELAESHVYVEFLNKEIEGKDIVIKDLQSIKN